MAAAETETRPPKTTTRLGTLDQCGDALSRSFPGLRTYEAIRNRATFVVNSDGDVLLSPDAPLDENDAVRVIAIGTESALDRIRARRVSATRVAGSLNLVGEGIKLPRVQSPALEAAGRPDDCKVRAVVLRDFAPGEGQIRLTRLDNGEEKAINTIAFPVNKLYHGILSFGGLASRLTPAGFTVVPNGGQTVIAEKRDKGQSVYAFFLSLFVLGPQDLEKRPFDFFRNLSLTLGLPVTDLDRHPLVAGLSLDWNSVVVTGGWHRADVDELSPSSGLAVGDSFSGTEKEIPLVRRPRTKSFLAVSVDLRAALALLNAATGAVPTGAK